MSTAGSADGGDSSLSPRVVGGVPGAGTGETASLLQPLPIARAPRRRKRSARRKRATPRGTSGSRRGGDGRERGNTTGTDTVEESLDSSGNSLSPPSQKPPLADAHLGASTRSVTSASRKRLRLKCHYKGHIRVVALSTKESSFRSLLQRLAQDYGFEVSLKYEDADSDLITLASQNDLNELLHHESGTVVVHVSEVSPVDVARVLQSPTPAASRSSAHLHPLEALPAPPSSSTVPRPVPTPTSARPSRNDRHLHLLPLSHRAETPGVAKSIRWQRGQILGQGAYGTVYLGLNLDTGELMAIKQLDTNQLSRKEMMALENEVNMMRGLYHENIVRYLGTDRADDTLSIFMEYVPGGSIRQLLERFGQFDESVRVGRRWVVVL